MANKEEVIFKVKAELAGFKKSMEDLKKVAKDSSKNIEKAMSMDLTDEGSKAGKSFAKGMNKELKSVTNMLKNELKIMSDKTYTIKVKLDSSSVERVKRDLSNIEIRVSASASSRANSSMSNNANAPNAANTMSSIANTAALTRLASEVNRAARLIGSKVPKLDDSKVKIDTDNTSVKVDTENVKVGVDTEGVKVGVDVGDVKVGIDTTNIPEIELKAPQIDPIDINVNIPDIPDVNVNVDVPDVTVEVQEIDPIEVDVQLDVDALENASKSIKQASEKIESASNSILTSLGAISNTNIDINTETFERAVKTLREAVNDIDTASNTIYFASQDMVNVLSKMSSVIGGINDVSNILGKVTNEMRFAGKDMLSATIRVKDVADRIKNIDVNISDVPIIDVNAPESIDVNLTPATDSLDGICEAMNTASSGLEEASKKITEASKNISDASSSIMTLANSSMDVNLTPATDALDRINVISDKVATKLSAANDDIGKSIKQSFDDSIKDIKDSISKAFDKPIKELKQAIETAFKKATSAMSQDTSKTLGKVPKTVKREIIQGFDSAGKNIKSVLKEAFSDGARAIADAIRRAGDDFTPPTSPSSPNNDPKVPPTPTKPTAPPRHPEDPKPPTSGGDADYRKEVQKKLQYSDKYGILTQLKTPSEQGIKLPKPFDLKDYYTMSEKVQKTFGEIPKVIEGSIDDIENVGNEVESEGKKIVKKIMHSFQDIKAVLDKASQEFEGKKINLDVFDNIESIDQAKAAIDRIESTIASFNEQIDKIMAATSKYKSINMHSLFGEDNPNIMQQSWDLAKELTDDKKIYGRKQENGKYVSRFINPQVFKQNQQVLKELRTAYRTLIEEVSRYQDKIDEIYSAEYRLESIAEGKSSLVKLAQQARIEYDSLLESVSRVHDEMSRVEREMEQVEATLGGADATQSSSVFNQYTNAMDNLQQEANELEAELEGLWRKLDEAELIIGNNPFDELAMDMEEVNDSVSQLRMNLQLLANEKGFGNASKSVKELKEDLDRISRYIKNLTALKNSKYAPSSDNPVMIDINKRLADGYKEYNETSKLLREALQREIDRDLKEIREYTKGLEKANEKLKEVQKTASNSNTKGSGLGFGKYSVNIKSELEKAESAAKEAKNAFDELSVTMDETGDSSSKLSMNLQLLANNQGKFDKLKNAIKNAFSSIESSTSQVISKAKTLFAVFGQKNAHVATHMVGEFNNKLNKLKENVKKVSASIKDIGTPFKKAFNGLSGIINKIISPIKKVTSGFRGMGNEAKSASGKVNGLTGSFKGLLGKLTMYFGIYEIFNIFKEGTKDAMKYEASIINLQMTYGDFAQELIDFANKQAVAFGISKKQVAEYGNIFSVIMRDVNRTLNPSAPASAISKQTVTMSQELIKSAGIIAGALGYETETVLEGLRSGLLGSSEAVDQYGLNLKVANLEQSKTFRQVANGKKSWNDLTTAQQQYIIAQEIINQTTAKFGSLLDKNGNIMKTTASLHAQFLAQWQNTKLAIGNLGKVIWTAVVEPLTKVLAVLEVIFNYAAGALTRLLEAFGIHVDLAADLSGSKELESGVGNLENNLGGLDDTASDTSDAIDSVGDSAQDTAKDTEDAAKKIKRALAGFDQINVLSLGDDEEDNKDPEIPDLGNWEPPALTTGDFGIEYPDSSEVKKKLDELMKPFKELEEFLEPFKAAWDELGDRWIAAWDRLKGSFKNFCDSLGDFLVSVWNNGGKEFVQHMAEIALAVGIAAMEIGGTILDSLAKLWKHLDPETNMNTQGFIDALNEVSVKIRDLILDLNTHFESLMNNGGQDVLNALGDMFMNLGEAAVRGVGVVIDAIDGLLDHLDPATNKKTQGALGGLEYLFKSIGDFALGLSDVFATFMDNGGQEFLNNIGDIVMILIDMAATITGDLLNAITAFFDSWAGHVVITVAGRALELVSSILKGLLEILEPLTPIISGVVAAIGAFMVASKITTAVTTIVTAFQNLGPILGIVKAGFSALWAVLAANPVALTVAAIVGIGVALVALYNKCEWFRDAVNKVFDRIREPLEKLKETFSEIIESIVNIFQDFIDIIVGIFTGDGERVGKAVRDMIENVINIFKNLWKFRQQMVEIGLNLILGLVEGIWECIKNLPQLLAGVAEFIFDFFVGLFGLSPETAEKIKQAGRDMIDSLCQGVMDAISAIGDFFGAIGDAIKQGIDNITSAEWWSNLGKAIAQPFIDAKDFVLGLLGDIAAGVGEWFGNKIDAALEKLGDIKDFLSDIGQSAKEALNAFCEWASGVPEAIGNALSNLKTLIVEGPIGDLVRAIGDKLGEIKDVASERIGIAVENASEKWGELTEELSGMLDDFIERNKERWERIKQDTAEKVRPIVDETVEKYTEMKDSVSTKLDELMAISEEAWGKVKDKIVEALSPIVDYYKNQWEYIKKMTADIADATAQVLGEIWNNTTGVLKAAWENMSDFAIEKSDYIKTMVSDIAEATNEVLSEIWNNTTGVLGAAWENMSQFAIGIFEYIKTMVSDIADATNEVLGTIWNNTTGVLQAAWENMSQFAMGVFDYIKTMVSDIAEATNEVLSTIWSNTTGVLEAAWNGMSEFAIGVFDYIKTMVSDIAEATNEVLSEIWSNTTGVLSAAWDGMSEFAIGVFEYIKTMVCDIADATVEVLSEIWNNATGVLGAAWDNFSKACIGVFEYIKTMASDITEATIEVLSEIWNNTTGVLGAAWDNFSETCIGVFEYIKTMVSDITEATVEVLGEIWGNVTGVLGAAWDGITDLVGDWVKGICDTIFDGFIVLPAMMKDLFNIDMFGFIKDALEKGLDLIKGAGSLGEKAYSIGKFIIEGIWDGIKTSVKAIGTFLSGVGDIIIGFFKDIFGIHSPSTVFAELGEFLIEGLVEGITDSMSLVRNAFDGVYDAICGAWDKIKDAWSDVTDFFSDIWNSVKELFVDKIKNLSIPKPKIEWDSVKTTAEKTINSVKTSVEKFKAKLPKPELSWNDLKTTLTDALNKLKETISRFKWELPKPKLPSFSVSGGKAPWGFMGQGSLPKVSVKWNAQGGIMNSPTIFGMTGNTLLGGGEAGAEAILPLDELWDKLDNSFQQQNQAIGRAIASSNAGSNRPVNIVLKVNDIEMGKVVVSSLKSLSNHSGTLDLPFNK